MARRQKSLLDDTFDLLKVTPIWVGPSIAALVFIVLRFVLPPFVPANSQAGFRPLLLTLSWVSAAAILLAWILAELGKLKNRALLESQRDLESIKSVSWREFERLVSEAYRRKGYIAEVVGTNSGDGGVDIKLTGHGETVLVQCKHWKARKVPVTTARELLGVVSSQKANRGILVTSGHLTREARAFERQNPQIELLDGPELVDLIKSVQRESKTAVLSAPPLSPAVPQCPLCGAEMALRIARKGKNTGSKFWGCSRYPACRGTRPAEPA